MPHEIGLPGFVETAEQAVSTNPILIPPRGVVLCGAAKRCVGTVSKLPHLDPTWEAARVENSLRDGGVRDGEIEYTTKRNRDL